MYQYYVWSNIYITLMDRKTQTGMDASTIYKGKNL